MNRQEAAHRASEAQRLLDEPLLNEALAKIERNALDEMLALDRGDHDGRLLLVNHIKVVRGIRTYLTTVVITGNAVIKDRRNVV